MPRQPTSDASCCPHVAQILIREVVGDGHLVDGEQVEEHLLKWREQTPRRPDTPDADHASWRHRGANAVTPWVHPLNALQRSPKMPLPALLWHKSDHAFCVRSVGKLIELEFALCHPLPLGRLAAQPRPPNE